MDILTYLHRANWIIGLDSDELAKLTYKLFQELSQKPPSTILLAEQDPLQFLSSFLAACAANHTVFLCNPNWVKAEWEQVFQIVQPDLICGNVPICNPILPTSRWVTGKPKIMIPTGGTSGKIRFAIHTWDTLMASVQGFKGYFQEDQINSYCLLPLYHVSGLMQFLRSLTTEGKLAITSSKELDNLIVNPEDYFISLVPTQLQKILQTRSLTSWLSQFKTVLLGGAPAWKQLLETAREHKIRLSPTYGMTETASQIATLKPEAFLAGNNSCGQILPHAEISIRSSQGKVLDKNKIGIITIKTRSLMLGYYPYFIQQEYFKNDDLGFIDDTDNLTIVGRNSHKIITGGENVFPLEVEAAILGTNLVTDVCVLGLPDEQWGEAVIAVYVPQKETSLIKIQGELKNKLSRYKQPKYWIEVEDLPRNAQGKLELGKIQHIIEQEFNKPIFTEAIAKII